MYYRGHCFARVAFLVVFFPHISFFTSIIFFVGSLARRPTALVGSLALRNKIFYNKIELVRCLYGPQLAALQGRTSLTFVKRTTLTLFYCHDSPKHIMKTEIASWKVRTYDIHSLVVKRGFASE